MELYSRLKNSDAVKEVHRNLKMVKRFFVRLFKKYWFYVSVFAGLATLIFLIFFVYRTVFQDRVFGLYSFDNGQVAYFDCKKDLQYWVEDPEGELRFKYVNELGSSKNKLYVESRGYFRKDVDVLEVFGPDYEKVFHIKKIKRLEWLGENSNQKCEK